MAKCPDPADVVVFALEWEAGSPRPGATIAPPTTLDQSGKLLKEFGPFGNPAWPNFGRRHFYCRENESAVLQNILVQEGVLERAVVEILFEVGQFDFPHPS